MASTESPTEAHGSTAPVDTPTTLADDPAAPQSLTMVPVPGATLAVRAQRPSREGLEPALFVHGLGGSSLNWLPLMELLKDRVDGEAVDLPGFGHSPPPDDSDYTPEGLAGAAIRYMEASGRGPVHLFGNSLGGAVTVRIAATRPDLVRTLTLISPALPELPPKRSALPTALVGLPGVPALFVRATRGWSAERRVRVTIETCYGDPSKVTEQELAAAAREYQRRVELPYFWDVMARSMRGVVTSYLAAGRDSLWRQAEQIKVPVLLIYGVRDKLVSYRMARRACAVFSDARLLVLPDSGHVAMLEHPEVVSRGVRELLGADDLKPSSGRS
ncbi:alpha/beta fold hydrolase [Wenjunlia tyrosinilytica]|uniref:Alpha/beta hydrolase n=1 Tax=Wenjunlia tyrosinilytica TaxID=1544741 RepID=A0A917ZKR3_9ACTN|nr:alpha/beta hydrolase [Wenjunlia tyrosinilytica]GGO85829.1 alpha/beta hydrolase [Wenjunlia tyrosinilytica]